jgi:hypothetical protein
MVTLLVARAVGRSWARHPMFPAPAGSYLIEDVVVDGAARGGIGEGS